MFVSASRQYVRLLAPLLALIAAFFGGPASAATSTAPVRELKFFRWATPSQPPETIRQFPAIMPETSKPGSLALGDLGDDGVQELLAGAAPGTSPHVQAFRLDGSPIFSFAAYDLGMRRGVSVAVGDIDGDGKDEIVTAPGPTGGPRVMVWTGRGALLGDFFAWENTVTAGLNIAVGDFDGDGRAEIATALAADASPYVRVYGHDGIKKADFPAIPGGYKGGLNLAAGDLNGDGKDEIIVVPAGDGGPHVHAFDGSGKLLGHFMAYDEPYRGGVLLAVGKLSDGATVLATAPAERQPLVRPELAKYIKVDLSEQRLRAYEYGRLAKSFLVATGMSGFDTPKGEYSILDRPYKVHYRWSYGPGNPHNYDMGWVTWNLRIMPHRYIHYAPWRKVFGIKGSHGCVNVDKASAQWIYQWGDLGTPVSIQD